jgi:hypothetical protein
MSTPDTAVVTATKTAVLQLRAPSAWKRAALLDAMKRTHLATEAVLQAILAELPAIQALANKTDRTNHMQRIAYATLAKWNLSTASAAGARVDAIGMVESYLQQLKDGREKASLPTVRSLEGREVRATPRPSTSWPCGTAPMRAKGCSGTRSTASPALLAHGHSACTATATSIFC